MKYITSFIIFCLILFIYLHVQFQLKTSDDLEIYEVDDTSKDKLEEICDLRQPVLFDFKNEQIIQSCCKDYISSKYPTFEIKIRNSNENEPNYLPLQIKDSIKLFNEDNKQTFFSENNEDFLQETSLKKIIQHNDIYLKPPLYSNCLYDIMMGSEGVSTPLRYEINYRNFFMVTQGNIKIKLTPPKNTKYLESISDYEHFEFRSTINPFSSADIVSLSQNKYKFLEVNLTVGKIIYIPAYWWYSIQFGKNTSVSSFRYRTYMNNIAIIPNLFMYVLQGQNIKTKVIQKMKNDDGIDYDINDDIVDQGDNNNYIEDNNNDNNDNKYNDAQKNNITDNKSHDDIVDKSVDTIN